MASTSDINTAIRLLRALNPHQAQGSLASQAADCAPVVEALGYYDLADHLRRVGVGDRDAVRESSPNLIG